MSKGRKPGQDPNRPMTVPPAMLDQMAHPNVEIPGIEDERDRERMLTSVRSHSRHVMDNGHVVINGAPVERPTLSDEVTQLLARSDEKGKDGKSR